MQSLPLGLRHQSRCQTSQNHCPNARRLVAEYLHQNVNSCGLQLSHRLVRVLNTSAIDLAHRHASAHPVSRFLRQEVLDSRVMSIRMLQVLAFCRERAHGAQCRVEVSVVPLVSINDLLVRRLIDKLMRKPIDARFQDVNRVLPRQRMGYGYQPMR
jgi:hypothetical protein